MAHECPECGMRCHCQGDLDDIVYHGTREGSLCTHCDDEPDYHEDEPDWFEDDE